MFMIETRRGKKEKRNLEETEFLALNREGWGRKKTQNIKTVSLIFPER